MAGRIMDGSWSVSKDVRGLIEKTRTRGITESEVEPLAEVMAQTLINSDPELDPAIAYEIALNEARTYVLGYTTEERQDPGYIPPNNNNNNGPYNDFQAYEGIFKRSEKKQRATKSIKAAEDIVHIEEVGVPLRRIAIELGMIEPYRTTEYAEPPELSQSILNYRNKVKNGTAGWNDLIDHIGDNISKAFDRLKALDVKYITQSNSLDPNRVKNFLNVIFGVYSENEVKSLEGDPILAYKKNPEIISRFLEEIPDEKKVEFGIERGSNGFLGFVGKDGMMWDVMDLQNRYISNNIKKQLNT